MEKTSLNFKQEKEMTYSQEAADLLDRVSFQNAWRELTGFPIGGHICSDRQLAAFLEALDKVRGPKEFKVTLPSEVAPGWKAASVTTITDVLDSSKPKRGPGRRPDTPEVKAAKLAAKLAAKGGKKAKAQLPSVESEPGQPMTQEEQVFYRTMDAKLKASTPDRDGIMAELINGMIKPLVMKGHRQLAIPRTYKGNTISLSPTFWRNSLKLHKVGCNDVDFTYDARLWRGEMITPEVFPLTLV